ncbi:MAG: hypothetical protein IKM38_04260 [Christensenellaceae bacterium]|nr:hypothetical protein [Christensenellaceae bacterium]
MKQKILYSEFAYILGLFILAFGTALMEKADFGLSMVVAPAYLLHLKISQFLPFFSFGMAEYTLQAVLILVMILLLRKAKLSYFFSFVTAVIYGFMLDGAMAILAPAVLEGFFLRLLFYISGMLFGSFSIALLFNTYLSPEAYELFVKALSHHFGFDLYKCKTIYDCTSCLISIILSFAFFGLWHFEGIKWGTVITALLNGTLIGLMTKLQAKFWKFENKFPWRKHFDM